MLRLVIDVGEAMCTMTPENVIQPHQQLLRGAIPIATDPGMLGIEGVGLQ